MTPELREQARIAAFAAPATIFMLAMFAVPLFAVFWQSITTNSGDEFSLAAYAKILSTPIFAKVAYTTFEISIGATIFAFVLAYPIAYFLAKQPSRRRAFFMILILVPFWTSSLVKSFAFTIILGHAGVINDILGMFGLGPVKMLYNRFGVMVGMSHFLVPFMVFPIMANLIGQPPELAKAAAIMGANKLNVFLRVTFPLSLPGVVAGALLVFILCLGFYLVPALLGSRHDMMMSNLVDFYAREVLDWSMASAIAVFLTVAAIIAASLISMVKGGGSILSEEAR
jgi:putative spermidine/putrescine transport system permease protein/mannopine transport system permease protein